LSALQKQDKFAPVKRSDGKYALSEERLDWQLENWCVWESAAWDAELAYTLTPGHSMSVDFDQMCAEMDRRCAHTVKAAIESLTPVEQCAVFNKLCKAVFRFRDEHDPHQAWIRARWRLAHDLYRRGMV
jgi:hypothetical protein